MCDDQRISFICNSICAIGRVEENQRKFESFIEKSYEAKQFLNDTSCLVLRATLESADEMSLSTNLNLSDLSSHDMSNNIEILFLKHNIEPLTAKNINNNIYVSSFYGSTIESMYTFLKSVWSPSVLQTSNDSKLSPKIIQLTSELESILTQNHKTNIKPVLSTVIRSQLDLEDISLIYEPSDEFLFWRKLKEDRRSPLCHFARLVDQEFGKLLALGYDDVYSLDLAAIENLIQTTFDILHATWTIDSGDEYYFPQKRMENLFRCIGNSIFQYIQKYISNTKLLSKLCNQRESGEARSTLQIMINICQQWIDIPRKLIVNYWSKLKVAWKGDIFTDLSIINLMERLDQVLNILSINQELTLLLTQDELKAYQIGKLLNYFEKGQDYIFNLYMKLEWEKLTKDYDSLVSPIENAIVSHLRANFSSVLDRPLSLLMEFLNYKGLLMRPTIRKLLITDRETLLESLKDLVKRVEQSVDNLEANDDDDDGNHSDKYSNRSKFKILSKKVDKIVQLKQLSEKLSMIHSSSSIILSDLQNFESFKSQYQSLTSRIIKEISNRFNSWIDDVRTKLENDDPSLSLDGSLLSWENGLLTVNFSSDLVEFIRETRQLCELGFEIPRSSNKKTSITDKVQEAEKFYRFGVMLQKTANFYNSLSEQIIDVQEQLLLESLKSFSAIVSKYCSSPDRKKGNEITWSNTAECERFIHTLQGAAEKLSFENRNLRKVHESLSEDTIILIKIDFLKQSELWKQKWKSIKDKVGIIKNKYTAKDCELWLLHWDHQIYKALEASYYMGIESLNENLPEVKVELVFSNKNLEFKPSLEQLRQTYYSEIRKFISIPLTFEGFGNARVYKKMISRTSKRMYQVYSKAEVLFDKLTTIISKYEKTVRLGAIDIDHFIEENVNLLDEYIINFKSIKLRRKAIDKLPDIEKVDCYNVSLLPFKIFLEDLLQRVNDSLLISLRRSILQDFKEVDSFLEKSSERLSTRPQSIQEVGLAKNEWKEIDMKKEFMKSLSRSCVEKRKLLLQYVHGTVVDVSEVLNRMANLDGEGGRWDEFDIALEAFNDLVEEQKEALKGTLDDDVVSLNLNIDKFNNRWRQLKPGDILNWEYSEIQRVFTSLEDWKRQFKELEEKALVLSESFTTFSMPKPRFDGLESLSQDIIMTVSSWDLLKTYYDEEKVIADQDWLTFSVNIYVLQDFALNWNDKLKSKFSKGKYDGIANHIATIIEKIKKSIPALKYCQGESFKEDHWTELLQSKLQLGRDVKRESVKVEHFLSRLDILIEPNTLSFVKNLQFRALGEVKIREALQELKAWERTAEINLLTQEESGRKIPLIKEWKDLLSEMGDKQSLLGSLKDSEFFRAFADQGLALEAKITTLDTAVHTLNIIQRKWVYLEPIFGRGALPAEESRFHRIDEEFSDIMLNIGKEPRLFNLTDEQIFPHLVDRLKDTLDQLERCQKALTDFLEAKRLILPRFYFIGDDDLLEILGQAKNPSVIQSHLKKLFQGINKVKFNQDCTKITAIISSANEIVELENSVLVNEKVESWLDILSNEMRSTLASMLMKCLPLSEFDWSYPSQILCLTHMVKFTEDTERAIRGGPSALENLKKQLQNMLRDLTSQDLSSEPLLQLKIKSLIFDMVHNIDVVNQLQTNSIKSIDDWIWKKQLRYYVEGGQAVVIVHNAKFKYTYEYQGNAPKLVHTPLTDKCYLTLTQGMHMGFGGNPYGPAGTGKTETVKALAACLGRQVLVFNCDEALESASMVRIFIGIIKCGAWGCFDEFNRLKEDQLSAISQQIQIIQDAIKLKISPIQLIGRSIEVDFNSGIFVTLNPAGKGYGGRSRLPNNLKALFRPVAMGAPDNELIAEVSLVTEGFTQAKPLSAKIVSLFKLSRQLLSNQQHYDWGLRGLKAVLNSGGRMIQSYQKTGTPIDDKIEYEILIRALRVNILSKLTYSDTQKFLPLINDVFPNSKSSDLTGGDLEQAIKEAMKEKPFHFVEDAAQIRKMIQLKESLDQRIGCVIVGPSGGGKSSLWRVLKAAMIKTGQKVITYVMNPKSMRRERLLGHLDVDTREWSDGVLTDAARKTVKESSNVKCWIICDGDVDPEWIESLNSVLDDNHLLTLPNGERIAFGSNVNFIFETHDLKYASPATVSRMGMIFLSDEELDVSRIVQKWLLTVSQEFRLPLSSWIDELFYKCLNYLSSCEYLVETTLAGTINNGLCQIKDCKTKQEFICGSIRGLGANLTNNQRISFAKEIFQWANERPPDFNNPLDCYAESTKYCPFSAAFLSPKDAQNINVSDIGDSFVLNTITVQRTLKALESLITHMEPFILVGPEGCGKSMMIKYAFKQKRNMSLATLSCNAQTRANDITKKISQSCILVSTPEGRVYRPREGERFVLYLKDINLPRPDKYETCELIAFLQQLITFEGFYDDSLEFLKLERIQIVASMNAATTVGRHPLSTRFTAIVRIISVDYPETQEMVAVYDSFLAIILSQIAVSDKKWTQTSDRERLATAIVEIYQKSREKFTVDDQRHYSYTLRDLTKLVKNICRYDLMTENLLDVIAYESNRVFRDRLVNADACNRFDQILGGVLRTHFRHANISSKIVYTSFRSTKGTMPLSDGESKDADRIMINAVVGSMLQKVDEDEFHKVVTQGVMYYEREEKDLNLLLFPEILEHINHIDRSLSSSNGHCLLVGRGGVGRRGATSLVTYMLGYQFKTLAIGRNYDSKSFETDIKYILNIAGIKGEHILLFIEDYQITSETFLEIINSLLSAGEVPGLYTHEELEPLLSPLREKMREAGTFKTPYDFFVSRVRHYLHIVLSMDCDHGQYLYRCESNPAITSYCTILWMGDWHTNTLQAVPLLMEGVKDLLIIESDAKNETLNNDGESKFETKTDELQYNKRLLDIITEIHSSCVIQQKASPQDYISFLKLWYTFYLSKKSDLEKEVMHLKAGLNKLETASNVVNDLRTNAVQQEKDLRIAQVAADRAMDDISKALSNASDHKIELVEVKKTVADNERKTQERKSQIEEELAEIQPLLDSAKQAVGSIKSEHLAEIRSLATPPEAIADVLAAVLMLLGVQDLSWQSMKRFLSNRGVKEEILNYDASKMSEDIRKNVAKLMKKKPTSFEDAAIARASAAAAPMAAWVKANVKYSIVIEKIEPLQTELEEETRKLQESTDRLLCCEDELKELDNRVTNLKLEFGKRTAEAERLKRNLEIAGTTLNKAEGLVGQLVGEQTRWKQQVQSLSSELQQLSIKMLLASGYVTYLSKSPEDIRNNMITKWMKICEISSFQFKRVMITESELLAWKSLGLPSDDLSQENGLSIYHSKDRFPFVIDPTSAATDWLKSVLAMDRSRPLEIVSQHDPRFSNQVELAVRFGKTLLILEVDSVEPMLYPLCRKDFMHQGARQCIQVGDKIVDYNENFRMVIATRNPKLNLPPDAASMVLQINFTVTKSGLEGQLLGLAIQHEQPELENAKATMLRKEEDFKVQLAYLEKELLQSLATAEGNLLENTSLIESLTKTKQKSAEIEEALSRSADASEKLDKQREVYRSFAQKSSKLFFVVRDLKSISNMYQFSLLSFLQLFKKTLCMEANSKDIADKLIHLESNLEIRTLDFVGQGLFKSDRLMFAMHLIKCMHPDQFQLKEWDVFIGNVVATVTESTSKNYPSWLSSDRYTAFKLLQEHLPNLISALELENPKWQRFAKSSEAEREFPPIRGITLFQRLLVLQMSRPDRLQSGITQFCSEVLRVDSMSPPSLSLTNLHQESDCHTPIMLISSPGSDPSKELQEFAERTTYQGQFEELAMGGGQLETAIHLLRSSAANGSWLCLKNLHLVVAWLPVLEKELSSIQPNKEFRLWLTTESHNDFPSLLLEESVKATYEAPPGLKMNLKRTFEAWNKESFDEGTPIRNRLFFLLACFHAVIQERRTYIPQGWSKFYEFSYGDLKAGSYALEAAVTSRKKDDMIDWEAIHGLMEDAIYGGRIESAPDMRLLKAYISMFLNEKLVSDKEKGLEILKGTPLRMSSNSDYNTFLKLINQMPDVDSPYIFGLPDNIDRSLQRALSSAVISQLRQLSVTDIETNKYDRERWRSQLGPILEVWEQLTGCNSGLISHTKGGKNSDSFNKVDNQNPVTDFVILENDLATELCNYVDLSLSLLKKVLFGSGLLTPFIQKIAMALLSGTIPEEWCKRWETGPIKPQSWLKELIRKRLALMRWRSASVKGALLNESLNLGELFNPATFISALRQMSARSIGCAIDKMKMVSGLDRELEKTNCSHICRINGLLLEGASIDSFGHLQESSPDANELVPVSTLSIGYVSIDSPTMSLKDAYIKIPVFVSTNRVEHLLDVDLKLETTDSGNSKYESNNDTQPTKTKWILAGVALFLKQEE